MPVAKNAAKCPRGTSRAEIELRIVAVSMVSNEADVIEAFVRHNGGILDALVVLDHGSCDRTLEILMQLAGEADVPLVVLQDLDRAFRQGERITMMARRYLSELSADWCFALDADEFIGCESRAVLEQVHLAHVPVRSAEQVAQKAIIGWLGTRLSQPERFAAAGQTTPAAHWKSLFDRIAAGTALDEGFMREAIAAYVGGPVCDADLVADAVPVPEALRLRYTAAGVTPYATIATWAGRMVAERLAPP